MDRRPLRALLVEDNPADAELLQEALPPDDARQLVHVTTAADAVAALDTDGLDVVILDLSLPDARDLSALATIKATAPHLPVIVLTGMDNEEMAIHALQHGAQDYLVKGQVEQRALVRSLRYAIERQRFEQERELFLSAVGHDLRNPISAVLMAAGLLLNEEELPERMRERVRRVASSAGRMDRLIEQLLTFARHRSGAMTLDRRPVDLVDVVSIVADEVTLAHPDARVVVSGAPNAYGSWDHDRLVQVVQNLVTNAVVHGARGSPVHVRVLVGKDAHTLEVENDGEPIPEQEAKNLFHPFRRRQKRGPGLGLGLSIAHQIASAHGGRITVRSHERGVVFAVRLPVADSSSDDMHVS
jgi:signal transduction histidine kinase